MANCNFSPFYLLMLCKNGTSPRQIPVHILMLLANKYPYSCTIKFEKRTMITAYHVCCQLSG